MFDDNYGSGEHFLFGTAISDDNIYSRYDAQQEYSNWMQNQANIKYKEWMKNIQGMMGSPQEPTKEFVEGIRWCGDAEREDRQTKLLTKSEK